ncbi:uncharacterized protein TM35_000481640 [Trypanosoma theileri]|uniref:Mucin-associated surface protein (MASP) n=1 Tax=Trypanosoma theileri TaxID=67003 RepID=A0A1X0NIA5_9TRYP|nr:uncharacterized protein TM35_000481640 [Trypanosoma theileri]ORC84203.1 hypothetical protein TM35_000481640 [Trypanosoma theileri]
MTTMFVQLRRVVYLLVLLQCCASVAFAEDVGDTAPTQSEVKKTLQKMRQLAAKIKVEKKDIEEKFSSMNEAREECKVAAQSAESDANECREFAKDIESVLKSDTDNKKEKKANELVKRCTETAKEVKKVADDVNKKAEAASAAAEKLVMTADELNSAISTYARLQFILPDEEEVKNEDFNVDINEYIKDYEEKDYAIEVNKTATAVKQEAAEAQKQAESATEAVNNLKEAIQKAKTAAAEEEAKKAAEAEQQNKAENSTEGQINNNEENGPMETTAENGPNTEKNISTLEQQNNNGVKENGTTVGSTNESETANKSTVAEILKSQNMLTNTSTGSVPLNISQLSDSSSSPALVHSPLLLLLVSMCVLGCTVIC